MITGLSIAALLLTIIAYYLCAVGARETVKRRRRSISVAGIVVIVPILALLSNGPQVDKKSLGILLSCLLVHASIFAAGFVKLSAPQK
jgi:ABC-type uncharacterized transport system permease subunit